MLMDLERQKENFRDHVATFTDYGNIKILDFKKPGSSHYRIRFLFEEDYCRLHISGDLGELIATNYNNMCYEKFSDFVHDIGYFEEKIDCHNRAIYSWDYDKAKEDLKKKIIEGEYVIEYDYWDDQTPEEIDEDFIEDVLDDFDDRSGIGSFGYEKLREMDPDCFEWCGDIGKEETGILELYMLAFELAQEQLSKNKGGEN